MNLGIFFFQIKFQFSDIHREVKADKIVGGVALFFVVDVTLIHMQKYHSKVWIAMFPVSGD